MKTLKIFVLTFFMVALALSTASRFTVQSQSETTAAGGATEAPAAFDNRTNGFIPQGTPPAEGEDPVPGDFVNNRLIFDEIEQIDEGLGPVYNAQGCG